MNRITHHYLPPLHRRLKFRTIIRCSSKGIHPGHGYRYRLGEYQCKIVDLITGVSNGSYSQYTTTLCTKHRYRTVSIAYLLSLVLIEYFLPFQIQHTLQPQSYGRSHYSLIFLLQQIPLPPPIQGFDSAHLPCLHH